MVQPDGQICSSPTLTYVKYFTWLLSRGSTWRHGEFDFRDSHALRNYAPSWNPHSPVPTTIAPTLTRSCPDIGMIAASPSSSSSSFSSSSSSSSLPHASASSTVVLGALTQNAFVTQQMHGVRAREAVAHAQRRHDGLGVAARPVVIHREAGGRGRSASGFRFAKEGRWCIHLYILSFATVAFAFSSMVSW